nr:unnamed protein product [Digitaria exilis]
MAVDKTLDYCVDKVLAEDDDSLVEIAEDASNVGAVLFGDRSVANESDGSLDVVMVDNLAAALSGDGGKNDAGKGSGGALDVGVMVANDLLVDARLGRAQDCPAAYPGRKGAGSAPPGPRKGQLQSVLGVPTPRELEVVARIEEVKSQPTRSSPRLAGVADHHILDKAKLRTAWKNLDHPVI